MFKLLKCLLFGILVAIMVCVGSVVATFALAITLYALVTWPYIAFPIAIVLIGIIGGILKYYGGI